MSGVASSRRACARLYLRATTRFRPSAAARFSLADRRG